MKLLLRQIGEQIYEGSRIALIGGTLLCLVLGTLLVSLENAGLIFEGIGSSIFAVLFLLSFLGVLFVVLFLPLELALAFLMRFWEGLARRIRVKLFYVSALVVGVLALHVFLSIAFNVIRDMRTRLGLVTSLSLLAVSFGLFLAINLISKKTGGERLSEERFRGSSLGYAVLFSPSASNSRKVPADPQNPARYSKPMLRVFGSIFCTLC